MSQAITTLKIAEGTSAWQDGKPLHITGETTGIDLGCYGRLRCPSCQRRMEPRTQHHVQSGAYRILCECKCGQQVAC